MSLPRKRKTLEDFALKGMHYAKMTGVMAASHAISDSFLLMHSGVGCKYKTAAQAAQHDLGEHPNEREACCGGIRRSSGRRAVEPPVHRSR